MLVRTDNAELRSGCREQSRRSARGPTDKPAAAKPLLAALGQATTPAGRIALLQLLVYTRGDEALNAVRKAMQEANAEVRGSGRPHADRLAGSVGRAAA